MWLSHSICMASRLPLLVIVITIVREFCPLISHPLSVAESNFPTVTCMASVRLSKWTVRAQALSLSLFLYRHKRTHTSCESVGFPRLFFILVSSLLHSLRNLSASFVH
jgi:phosphatidylglycerophosphate synthase